MEKTKAKPKQNQAAIERYVPIVVRFFTTPPNQRIEPNEFNGDSITYNINANPVPSKEKNEVLINLDIKIFIDETMQDLIGELNTNHLFVISNLKDFLAPKAKKEVENGFFATLIGISISTTRGILLAMGAGTPLMYFKGNILPIVNPYTLMQPIPKKQAKKRKPTKKKN